MSSDSGKSDYRLTLRPLPAKYGDPPPINRLRRLLKIALRCLGLRCTSAEAIRQDGGKHCEQHGDGEGI